MKKINTPITIQNLSHLEKLVNLPVSSIKHLGVTLNKVRSRLIKLHQGNESIIDHALKILSVIVLLLRKKRSYIVVFLQRNKWMIWKDSVMPYNLNFLIIDLLRIVDQELISKEKVLKPFWNSRCQENSKKLWLPIKTDCVDLDLTLSNSFVPRTVQNSLYLTEKNINLQNRSLQKTSYPLSQSLPVNRWEKESTEQIKAKKIKLYPDNHQRKLLEEWFNTSRFVYNKTLNGVLNDKDDINKLSLRNKYVTSTGKVEPWELNTPKTIRQQAVFDLCKAYKTCFSQLRSGIITKFNVNFKSKKNKAGSIGIEKGVKFDKKSKSVILFPNKTKKSCNIRIGKRQSKEDIKISKDCRICYDGYNFYLCIPETYECKETLSCDTIALDPGTRCFSTGYDPSGKVLEFHRTDKVIHKLKNKISLLQSLRKKRIKVVRQRIKNCVTELHWSTINHLVKNYKHILLPNFESQKVSQKSKNRHLNRDLNIYSHYLFKQRLHYKAKTLKVNVYDVNEAYTSKTCSNCGYMKNDLGSNKIFSCKSCKIIIDRDYNGARNILLKYLA